jgi:2-keto-4-pentenoate hydratase
VAGYLPAVELGDYRTGDNPRSLQMTLVCNTFSGGIVVGGPLTPPHGLDLRTEGMVLSHNGAVVASATAVEVLGDPLRSVAFIANKLGELGGTLRAGMVLMTGSIVKSIPLASGDTVGVAFTRLGSLHLGFRA